MERKKIAIGKKELILFLLIYLTGILVWDYTYVYKIALLLMLAVTMLVYRSGVIKIRPYLMMSTILFLYFFFYTMFGFSTDFSASKEYLVTLAINLAAAFACEYILSDNLAIEKIMRYWIILAVLISVYVCVMGRAELFSGNLGEAVQKPITGGSYSHNDLALAAAFALVFLNYFKMSKMKIKGNYLIQAFLLIFIVLTGARKSLMLAITAVILYPLIFAEKKKNRSGKMIKAVKIISAVMLVFAAFYLILTNPFLYKLIGYRFAGYFSGMFSGKYTESSAFTREIMKKTAVKLIRQKPWFGWGLNTFRTFKGSFGTWSHINYYEIWVSGGIVAVLIYYSFYLYVIQSLLKIKEQKMRNMFLVIMLFMFVMDYLSVTYVSRFMGMIYVMVDSYIINQKREEKAKEYV